MRNVGLILRREFAAYLRTPTGWIVASAFLLIVGLLFNGCALKCCQLLGKTCGSARLSAEVVSDFFFATSGPTMVAALTLAMRLLAEERQLGTIVLLHTSPVRDWEVVLGKFLSAFLFLAAMVAITVYMPLLVKVHGKISAGHVTVGYLGLLLLGGATVAIGLFGSSLAKNQVLALVFGLLIWFVLLVLWFVARRIDPPLRDLVASLSLHSRHFSPFMDGTVHVRDVVFYLALTYFFLLGATKVLEARRWQ